ncbi:hypothetical protein [Natronomonas sp. EA1]|uniref:hypothetical protein n=1 Tax=Natronomonas sp. EA1 TaxID=3421655 RepID=UPI003EC0836E
MASESQDGGRLSEPLPDDLTRWLDERAEEQGVSRETFVQRLVNAYRLATESDASLADTDDIEAVVEAVVEARQQPSEEALADLKADIEADTENKLDDVRRRVLQVKEEAESRAPADHDHEEFAQLDDLERSVAEFREEFEDFRDTVVAHDDRLDDTEEAMADLDGKLTRVAHAVVQLRSSGSEDGTLDRLKHEAAIEGVDQANCGACGESVNIALLTEPACPHCDTQVRGVEPASGFFGKPRLTGDRSEDDE